MIVDSQGSQNRSNRWAAATKQVLANTPGDLNHLKKRVTEKEVQVLTTEEEAGANTDFFIKDQSLLRAKSVIEPFRDLKKKIIEKTKIK